MNAWMRAMVPARHRVLFGTLTQQTRRSVTGSQCDRQATQLLVLLSGTDMRIDECVALLDGDEERWLTDGRSHALVDATLQEAMARFGRPGIFNTDQGSQFTSPRFTEVLTEAGVRISMD